MTKNDNETERTTTTIQLDPAHDAAVHDMNPNILVIAGPGSGKSLVLTERIKYLIEFRCDPHAICAVSFTNAGAEVIQQRIGSPVLKASHLGYCGTLHGLCLRLLIEYADSYGFTECVSVVSDEAMAVLVEDTRANLGIKASKKDVTAALAAWPVPMAGRGPADILAMRVHDRLTQNDLVTFDTLLHYGLLIAQEQPMPFEHLLVDEVQDSGIKDAAIYRALKIANKFMVGDPDQSIYAWRGGSLDFILDLARTATVYTLEGNYRSGSSTCEAATRLIRHNRDRVDKATVAVRDTVGQMSVTTYQNERSEVSGIASIMDGFGASNCAILTRTRALARKIGDYLSGMGIPVATRHEIQVPQDYARLLNFLAVLVNPENNMSAMLWLGNEGKAAANEAALAGKSINAHCLGLPWVTQVEDVAQRCAENGISPASCAIVRGVLELNPLTIRTVSDLLLALREPLAQSEGEGCFIGTYHSAKGREWPVVFLPACEEGIIPHKMATREEERRLFFVGITRGQDAVYISYSQRRKLEWGPEVKTVPSPFISEALGEGKEGV